MFSDISKEGVSLLKRGWQTYIFKKNSHHIVPSNLVLGHWIKGY